MTLNSLHESFTSFPCSNNTLQQTDRMTFMSANIWRCRAACSKCMTCIAAWVTRGMSKQLQMPSFNKQVQGWEFSNSNLNKAGVNQCLQVSVYSHLLINVWICYLYNNLKKKNHGLSPCFKSYTHCFTQVIANPPTGARLYFCVINIPFTVCKFD